MWGLSPANLNPSNYIKVISQLLLKVRRSQAGCLSQGCHQQAPHPKGSPPCGFHQPVFMSVLDSF